MITFIHDLGMQYPTSKSKKRSRYGLHRCHCGKEFRSISRLIASGKIKSCGCARTQKIIEASTTHGMTNHRLYNTWKSMINRTSSPLNPHYNHYGGRGISVCNRWKDARLFIEDMYPSFKEGLTLDRIDNNGNYKKSNCRWTTKSIQAQNTKAIQVNNTSGSRGIVKHNGKWKAQIGIGGKLIVLGSYSNKDEAVKAYNIYVVDNKLEHNFD